MKRIFHPSKNARRHVRHARVRARIVGTADRPRLSVFRGNRSLVAQLIDDASGQTLAQANSRKLTATPVEGKQGKVAAAFLVGQTIAAAARAKGITKVIFDRGGYQYHGRVAAVADGARAGGLKF